jgi:hypothetical protein
VHDDDCFRPFVAVEVSGDLFLDLRLDGSAVDREADVRGLRRARGSSEMRTVS